MVGLLEPTNRQLVWQTAKPGEAGAKNTHGRLRSLHNRFIRRLIYDFSYAGFYAIDWNTGKIAWHYSTPAMPFESATYPSMTLFSNSPQIQTQTLLRKRRTLTHTTTRKRLETLCLNATTGEYIWISRSGTAGAVADGYLTYDNRYDGYMYVLQSPSQTTVSAPQTSITQKHSYHFRNRP